MTRSPLRLLVAIIATALGVVLLAPAGPAAAAYCGITWGSLAKSGIHDADYDTLRNVRAGRHTCYDRLVIDLADAQGFSAYSVRYGTAYAEGSGAPLSLRGTDMRIELRTHAQDPVTGKPTFVPAKRSEVVDVSGFRTFRQVAWGGSYEGHTTLGLGVRARLPFRVTVLAGAPGHPDGARVIVDVAHAW
jgi:hypothetical protein